MVSCRFCTYLGFSLLSRLVPCYSGIRFLFLRLRSRNLNSHGPHFCFCWLSAFLLHFSSPFLRYFPHFSVLMNAFCMAIGGDLFHHSLFKMEVSPERSSTCSAWLLWVALPKEYGMVGQCLLLSSRVGSSLN